MILGAQFKAIVEYAPSQRVPKPNSKKDSREGTIYKGNDILLFVFVYLPYMNMVIYSIFLFVCCFWVDPDYLEFLKFIAKPVEHLPSAEIQLERKEAELAG